MRETLAILDAAFRDHRPALCFSGGKDSSVLLHLTYTATPHRPPAVFVDTGNQDTTTEDFCQGVCADLGTDLQVAKPDRTPPEQWARQGYPVLGCLAARNYMRRYRHLGAKIDCAACCNRLKIMPGRKLTKALGCDAQLVGNRATDDGNRYKQHQARGSAHANKADGLTIYTPLAHWTDVMIRRYIRMHGIPEDPASSEAGNGCLACAGGWRFERNQLATLRKTDPEKWREFVLVAGAMVPLLSVKFKKPVAVIAAAIDLLGGPEEVLERYPHVMDYCQVPPLRSYEK